MWLLFPLPPIENPSLVKSHCFFSVFSLHRIRIWQLCLFFEPTLTDLERENGVPGQCKELSFLLHATVLCMPLTQPFCSLIYFPLVILLMISSLFCFLPLCPLSPDKKIQTFFNVVSLSLFILFYFDSLGHLISFHQFNSVSPNPFPYISIWAFTCSETFRNFLPLTSVSTSWLDIPDLNQFPPDLQPSLIALSPA